jgi:hypothetical protein
LRTWEQEPVRVYELSRVETLREAGFGNYVDRQQPICGKTVLAALIEVPRAF